MQIYFVFNQGFPQGFPLRNGPKFFGIHKEDVDREYRENQIKKFETFDSFSTQPLKIVMFPASYFAFFFHSDLTKLGKKNSLPGPTLSSRPVSPACLGILPPAPPHPPAASGSGGRAKNRAGASSAVQARLL